MFRDAGYADALAAAGYRAILFDHRGHGRSGKPLRRSDHRTIEYVEDAHALLDTLAVRSASVIGYSQGMHVAMALAATHPDRVSAVVGIGAVGAADDPTDWRHRAAASIRAEGTAAAIDAFVQSEREPPPASLVANLASTDPEIFALLLEAATDDETGLWDYLPQIVAPTLLVVGEVEEDDEDHGSGLAGRNARKAAETIPRGEAFVVPGLAHLAIFWRSDLVLPTILGFLSDHDPAAGARRC